MQNFDSLDRFMVSMPLIAQLGRNFNPNLPFGIAGTDLRKYGPSKERRPNPIVEMGLFMDSDGIPLSMCITSGSDNEQTTAVPLEENSQKCFMAKSLFIVQMPEAVFNDYDYRLLSTDQTVTLKHMKDFDRFKEEIQIPRSKLRGMTELLFSKFAPRGGVFDPKP